MKKNQNLGFFSLPFFSEKVVGGWCRAGQVTLNSWQGSDSSKWEQLFSYVTYCINLIHIALNCHQDIP